MTKVKMPPIKKQVKAWSWTAYSTYKKCPRQYMLTYLCGLPKSTEKSPALENGIRVHKIAEDYVKGILPAKVPTELAVFGSEFKRLRTKRQKDPSSVIVEEQWAFSNARSTNAKGVVTFSDEWGPSYWNDWNGCWVRIKMDIAERTGDRIGIIDVKTGKYRPQSSADYEEQMELYGTSTLQRFGAAIGPGIKVFPRLLYVDAQVIHPPAGQETVYAMKDLPGLIKTWNQRVTPMFNDKKFPPKPNNLCGFCDFSKAKGGICEY